MKKGTLIGILVYIVFFCVLYLVFTNETLVFEAFEVKANTTDVFTDETNERIVYSNLRCVRSGECILTLNGWLKIALYFVLIPFIVAWFFSRRVNRKVSAKKEQVNNNKDVNTVT